MNAPLIPVCDFERMSADDVLDAVKSISSFASSDGDILPAIGNPHELYLDWAVKEIDQAERAKDPNDQQRCATNALMHARRALSCIVDQYLLRDGFTYCKSPPSNAIDKADTLVRRRIFDNLARGTLARAVDRRNEVEHQYRPANLEQAADSVHYIRSTIEACLRTSSPFCATVIYGVVLGSHGCGPNGPAHQFFGWSEDLFVIAHCAQPQWCGVVLPHPGSQTHATVRWTPMKELSCGQLLDVHDILDLRSRPGSHCRIGDDYWQQWLISLGMVQPV